MADFTEAEHAYLASQRLGRLSTVDPSGQPQANPVLYFPQDDGTIIVGGMRMGASKKWRNLQTNPKIAIVVDDIVSVTPWRARFVEVRGTAELVTGAHDLGSHFSAEVIRIHPQKIHSYGVNT